MTAPLTPSPAPPQREGPGRFRDWHDAPSPMMKINWLLAQYRPVVLIALAALFWFGMQMTGPGARIAAAETRISALERGMQRLIITGEAVARLQCFNESYSQQQRELAGLDCEAVLRGEYVRSRP